ncbi:MAG TPA: hypothetical protein VFZ10_05520 [Geminicoccaceae bacterium]
MLGRVLFAFVWLIVAAGLVLPLYPHPRGVATSVVTAASDPVQTTAASRVFGCEDCPVAEGGADCRSDCPCDQVLPAVFVPLEEGLSVTLAVSARAQTPEPAKLPAKLPAI